MNAEQHPPTDAPAGEARGADPIERLTAEVAAANDRALRAAAETENVRKRARRELDEALKYGPLPLARDLLPVIDNISRAIEAAEKTADLAGLLEGIKITAQLLAEALSRQQCVKIVALHEPFDPNHPAAVIQQPSADFPPRTVLQVLQDGYRFFDRVVRPAQVIVSTAPPATAE